MKKLRPLLCLLLCAALCVGSFTACARSAKESAEKTPVASADGGMLAALSEPLHSFNRMNSDVGTAAVLDGRLWMLGWSKVQGREKPQPLLLSTDAQDATESVELRLTAQAGETVEPVLLAADKSQLYLVTEHLWENGTARQLYLHHLAVDGSLTDSVLLDVPPETYISQAVVQGGTVWLIAYNGLYRAELATGICTAIPLPERFSVQDGRLLSGSLLLNGIILAGENVVLDGGGSALWQADVKTGALSAVECPDELDWTTNVNGIQRFDTDELRLAVQPGGTDVLAVWDSKGIWYWDTAAATAQPVYRWLDSGLLAKDIQQVYDLGGELIYGTMDGSFYRLLPADSTALQSRTVITVGCAATQAAGLEELVTAFNQAQPDVMVQIIDYTVGGGNTLSDAIIRGEVPDVLLLSSGGEINSYLGKGLFRDLYPLLDADPELQRGDFLPNILRACEADGQLPILLPYFNLLTAVGSAEKLGAEIGWSWEEYAAACAAEPALQDPIYGFGRSSTLLYHLQMGGSRFIDYSSGKANLDTPAFAALLQASAGWSEEGMSVTEDPKERFRSGNALLYTCFIQSLDSCRTLRYLFEDGPAYKGFPNDLGSSGSAATMQLCVGITNACQKPDAAWLFVRQFLLPAYQDRFAAAEPFWKAFPVRQDSLEKLAVAAMQDGWCVSGPAFLDPRALEKDEYWEKGIPQEDADRLLELVRSVDVIYRYDGVAAEILQEEASRLYAGACTPQEAAQVIQQRVQLYLDEQQG